MFHKSLFQCIKSNTNDDQSIIDFNLYQEAVGDNVNEVDQVGVDFAAYNVSTSTKATNDSTSVSADSSARSNVQIPAKFIDKLSTIRKIKQKIDSSLSLNSNKMGLINKSTRSKAFSTSKNSSGSSCEKMVKKKKLTKKRCNKKLQAQVVKNLVLSSTMNVDQTQPIFNATIISSIGKAPVARDYYSDDSDLSSDDSDVSLNDESFQTTEYVNVSSFMRNSRNLDQYYCNDQDDFNSSLSSVSSCDDDFDYECSTFESYLFNTIERQRRSAQTSVGKARFNPLISSSRFNILEKTAHSQINNPSPSTNRSRSIKRFQSGRRNIDFVPNNTSSRKSLLVSESESMSERTCYNTLIGYECQECNSQLARSAALSRRDTTLTSRQISYAYSNELSHYGGNQSCYSRDFEDVNVCSSTLISNGFSQHSLKAPVSYCSSSVLSSFTSSSSLASNSTLSSANSSSLLSSTTISNIKSLAAVRRPETPANSNYPIYKTANISTLSSLF